MQHPLHVSSNTDHSGGTLGCPTCTCPTTACFLGDWCPPAAGWTTWSTERRTGRQQKPRVKIISVEVTDYYMAFMMVKQKKRYNYRVIMGMRLTLKTLKLIHRPLLFDLNSLEVCSHQLCRKLVTSASSNSGILHGWPLCFLPLPARNHSLKWE